MAGIRNVIFAGKLNVTSSVWDERDGLLPIPSTWTIDGPVIELKRKVRMDLFVVVQVYGTICTYICTSLE